MTEAMQKGDYMLWTIAATAAVAVSVSIDALAVSFAYGCKKIYIPLLSLVLINVICTAVIGLSFFFGTVLVSFIPQSTSAWVSFIILFLLGLTKLFDSITKSIIRKYAQFKREIKLSIFSFKLVMHLYADPEAADVDISKCISPKEATVLAISLSLDGFAVGLSAAFIGIGGLVLVAFTLTSGFVALALGSWLGQKAADTVRFNISWVAGVMLIGLAVLQVV